MFQQSGDCFVLWCISIRCGLSELSLSLKHEKVWKQQYSFIRMCSPTHQHACNSKKAHGAITLPWFYRIVIHYSSWHWGWSAGREWSQAIICIREYLCVCVCIAELCFPAVHMCVKSFSLTDEMNVAEASASVPSEGCRCSTDHASFHIWVVKSHETTGNHCSTRLLDSCMLHRKYHFVFSAKW